MSNTPNGPDRHDPRRPEEPVYPEDTPVEERDTSPPEARAARGVNPGAARILFLIVGAILVIYVVVLLSGAVDLGGDAPQADEIIQESPQVDTPSVP